jgi:hypothetical protein
MKCAEKKADGVFKILESSPKILMIFKGFKGSRFQGFE